MKQEFRAAVKVARKDKFDPLLMALKLAEETGELAEATLAAAGYKPGKVMKEPMEGEAADVILCAIAVITKAYPNDSVDEIVDRIAAQMTLKTDKWLKKIS